MVRTDWLPFRLTRTRGKTGSDGRRHINKKDAYRSTVSSRIKELKKSSLFVGNSCTVSDSLKKTKKKFDLLLFNDTINRTLRAVHAPPARKEEGACPVLRATAEIARITAEYFCC